MPTGNVVCRAPRASTGTPRNANCTNVQSKSQYPADDARGSGPRAAVLRSVERTTAECTAKSGGEEGPTGDGSPQVFHELTDFYRRLREFESHPLGHSVIHQIKQSFCNRTLACNAESLP